MYASGELFETLGLDAPSASQPTVVVTPAARRALEAAVAQHGGGGRELHLSVDATFESHLSIAPRARADVEAITEGITILLDPISASRADGITIDVADTPSGQAFRVDNPNAPRVRQMSVRELASLLESGERFELLDVRTPEERAIAAIPGSIILNETEAARIESLARDTMLVLHCHHGGRSQQAAEQFVALGFSQVWNVVGGIDAWSQEIDPDVPRY